MSTFNVPILDGAGKVKSANLPTVLADIVANGGVSGGTGGATGPISYNNLTDKPVLVTSYTQLTDKPTIPTSYNDLTDQPTIPVVNTASTTVAGVVELATNAETTTGTDAARAVTPAGVKAVADTKAALSHTHTAADLPASTTTGSGIVELATTAETTTGTDTVRAVTPAGLKAVADTKVSTDGTITNTVKLTQAAYTALGGSVSATTLYVIVG